MKNPGSIIQLPDGRKAIVYRNQPLLEAKGKVVLHLVDEEYTPILGENGRLKTLIKDVEVYNAETDTYKLIGYVD